MISLSFFSSDLKLVETWPELKIDAFYLSSEEVKSAAGQAFGAIAVGNVNHFLPYILNGDPSNKVVQEAFNEFMLNQPENSLAYVRQFWNPSGVKSVSPPSKTRRLICEVVIVALILFLLFILCAFTLKDYLSYLSGALFIILVIYCISLYFCKRDFYFTCGIM